MRVSYIGSRSWRFRLCKTDIFAPCYPASSSRYGFGSDRAFMLLQPEVPFARRQLPLDTPHPNWDKPKTIRDKTRVAYRNSGRGLSHPRHFNIRYGKPCRETHPGRRWQSYSVVGRCGCEVLSRRLGTSMTRLHFPLNSQYSWQLKTTGRSKVTFLRTNLL